MMRSSITNCDAAAQECTARQYWICSSQSYCFRRTEELRHQDERNADERRYRTVFGLRFRLGTLVTDEGRAADDRDSDDADDESGPLRAGQSSVKEQDREDADPAAGRESEVSFSFVARTGITYRTSAPRSIWYTETGTKKSPTFMHVVAQLSHMAGSQNMMASLRLISLALRDEASRPVVGSLESFCRGSYAASRRCLLLAAGLNLELRIVKAMRQSVSPANMVMV